MDTSEESGRRAAAGPPGFRREARRLASRFLSQKLTQAEYVAGLRKAAIAAGLAEKTRKSRGDSILDVLAWGTGSIAPGEFPARLEPHFRRWEQGDASTEAFAEAVVELLAQLRRGS